jgi:hypothetical protein
METEQFQLILELISGTTGDAKDVAIVWLVIQGLSPVVTVIGYCLTAWVVCRVILMISNLINSTSNGEAVDQIAMIVQSENENTEGRNRFGGSYKVISNNEIVKRVKKAFKEES